MTSGPKCQLRRFSKLSWLLNPSTTVWLTLADKTTAKSLPFWPQSHFLTLYLFYKLGSAQPYGDFVLCNLWLLRPRDNGLNQMQKFVTHAPTYALNTGVSAALCMFDISEKFMSWVALTSRLGLPSILASHEARSVRI